MNEKKEIIKKSIKEIYFARKNKTTNYMKSRRLSSGLKKGDSREIDHKNYFQKMELLCRQI